MNVLSLFAGIGGLDLGLEAHGCETVAYSEVDDYASRIMAQRFPEAVNVGDITKAEFLRYKCGTCTAYSPTTINLAASDQDVELILGGSDGLIIAGGFPCQDISLAGTGEGLAGERSGLWRYYADAIRILRPRGVVVENVAALLARGIGDVLGDLAACGYDAEWDCIPAAAVGAPHLRDRVFLIAYRSDADGATARADADRDGFAGLAERHGEQAEAEPVEQLGRDAERLHHPDRRPPTADTDCNGRVEGQHGHAIETHSVRGGDGTRRQARWSVWPKPAAHQRWEAEPGVGRVAYGVPDRVDRIRCLGNAVVPQVAEHVAGILMERIR